MGKYIDAEALIDELDRQMADLEADVKADKDNIFLIGLTHISVVSTINDFPAADVVPVVRCAECKYQDKGENDSEAWNLCGYRPWLHIPTEDDAFCSKGERKDG